MTNSISHSADKLLGRCPKDPLAPHYTEDGFRLKLLASRRNERRFEWPGKRPAVDYLARREWRGLMFEAHLTGRQHDVLRKRLSGWTFKEIGDAAGHSKQSARKIYAAAIKKIAHVLRVYRFRGLSEVYRGETSRGRNHSLKGKMVR